MTNYSEVRIDYYDDIDGVWTVDAWKTDDDNEEGEVVATINPATREVTYLNPAAKHDALVREEIDAFMADETNFEDSVFGGVE